jgi:hypothetical protein
MISIKKALAIKNRIVNLSLIMSKIKIENESQSYQWGPADAVVERHLACIAFI